MFCQDRSLIVNLFVLLKKVLRHICLNLLFIRCNLFSGIFVMKPPENGLRDWALYICFISSSMMEGPATGGRGHIEQTGSWWCEEQVMS